MGIIGELGQHIGTDIVSDIAISKEERGEKHKWGAFFALCALAAMAAFTVQKNSMKGADLLGGRKTIERFMHSNITAMVILLASAVGFIVVCFKTWKGRRGSIYQLIYTVAAGIIIFYSGATIFKAIHNIQKDLDAPVTVSAESYVLCREGGNYLLVFDEPGTIDSILLVIPPEKYAALKKAPQSKQSYLSRSWRLVTEEEYRDFTEPVLCSAEIEVSYFKYSVIYDDCKFKEIN